MLSASLRLTMIFLTAALVACGDSGGGTTGGSTGDATTGGATTTTTGTSTSPTSTDDTTAGSLTGTQETTDPTTGPPDPSTSTTTTSGPDLTSTGPDDTTGPVTTETDPDTGSTTDVPETSGTSTTGEPSECPIAPDDNACETCNKMNCCDEAMACSEDPPCQCFFGCLQMGNSPMMCAPMCQIMNPGMNPLIAAAFECSNANCAEPCPP